MPIHKPVKTTIHADDFRDKAYRFTVESVLGPEVTPGVVVVSASTGYGLTLSPTDRPKREQIIRYSQQADGSWVASTTVTVVATGEALVEGTVTVRESGAETVVMPINTPSASLGKPQTLLISQSKLTFIEASRGKPSFQILAIARPHVGEPITLTTDSPDQFQLASDSRPAYGPALTLNPSAAGAYVHVRYLAKGRSAHTGQLTICSGDEIRTVALEGRSAGLLSVVRPVVSQPAVTATWVGLSTLTLVVGLGYAGYTKRCELFPALCRNETFAQTATSLPISASAIVTKPATNHNERVPKPDNRLTRSQEPSTSPVRSSSNRPARPLPNRAPDQAISLSRDRDRPSDVRKTPEDQAVSTAAEVRPRRRAIPVPVTEVSDLERALNQPIHNQ